MDDNLENDLEKLKIDHSRSKGPTRRKSGILLLFIGLVAVSIALFLFKDFIVSSKNVSIITVHAQSPAVSPVLMTAGGYIVAESEITVSSKVAGRIATLPVREGDEVIKGDILAILDNEELRVQMEEAEANVEKARLNLQAQAGTLRKRCD